MRFRNDPIGGVAHAWKTRTSLLESRFVGTWLDMLSLKEIGLLVGAGALGIALAAQPVLADGRGIGVPPSPVEAEQLLARVHAKVEAGEQAFATGDFEHARTAFDDAVDVFIDAGFDLRSDPALMAAYRETVERVNRYQSIGLDAEGDSVWPMQEYEATADDFPASVVPDVGDVVAANGDLLNAAFLTRISELQRRFHDKFGRTFTVTGLDTGVHSRLYGHGRAADVRVRDLTEAQVQFVVANARSLNMRALDFSTMDRVLAHNMRVISLGRPSDTMATGMHVHLNDQPRTLAGYAESPAAKRRFGSGQ